MKDDDDIDDDDINWKTNPFDIDSIDDYLRRVTATADPTRAIDVYDYLRRVTATSDPT